MNPATLSVMSLWTAATLYAIAMVAYSARLASVVEVRSAKRADAPVAVGAAGTGDAGAGDSGVAADAGAGSAPEAPAPAVPARSRAFGIGTASVYVGAALHLLGVVTRGIDAGHAPFSNMYEFAIAGSFVAVAVFLGLQRKRDVTYIAPGLAFVAAVVVVTALRVWYVDATGLRPALDSYWLVIHVPIAVVATGIFTVSGIASAIQVARDARDRGKRWASARWLRVLESAPQPARLEALAFRLNAWGFVLWTFTVMTGAMWAEHAWGRFWGWDPKEVWSFVIWIIYAAYLHSRTTQGWAGRRAAWLAISGLIAVIMNFTVVNLFVQGLHSYSGLQS